ncbi:TolC family outer membrane protein [uncultured Cohaesibacter sp.]|uniref:TolC family outer membrane protein n=1 Tax=uncultured Cohaesibacter sp. TaxID=1002546 RepID=UPI00292FD805|nr:TolC family outer membrane protein [uncultured Cohaesibacter sp.]
MTSANAENLAQALSLAYSNNPTLNAARAGLRSTDENVPQALSAYRPTVSASGSATRTWRDYEYLSGTSSRYAATTTSLGLQVQQILYRGNRTRNGVKQAEAAIQAARESLKATEQSVLLDVATAYMDILQNQAILELRKQNVAFLREQARSAKDRFAVGETINTDVNQAEASLAAAISLVYAAEATLSASQATYQQLVGKKPGTLVAGYSVDNLFPKSVDAAVKQGISQHPSVQAAKFNVDANELAVKIAEGALLPTVSVTGETGRSWTNLTGATNSASITGAVSIPLYSGGANHSAVRQAKETLGQTRIQLDLARDQIRAGIVSAWGLLQASTQQITAAKAGVKAARLATRGVVEEQKVGQRTLLDVLDAQEDEISARISLIEAQHDRIVASFSLASATGNLSAANLKLKVKRYDPTEHYKAVRDKWFGLRTPDGR